MTKGANDLPVKLQDRDWDLLRGLFESRIMTTKHVAALYFPGTSGMAKQRLQKLKRAGIVRERPRRSRSDPSVLFLSRLAFRLLQENGKLTDYPQFGIKYLDKRMQVSELKLRHELEVMDVKAAMVPAIKQSETLTVAEFSTWPMLYEFESCDPQGRLVKTQPDAFLRIHEKLPDGGIMEHPFFIEVDRSEEATTVLAERAYCYGHFYRDGGLAVRNGEPRANYKEFFFRVLLVCKTAERRNNLAAKMLLNNPPVHTQVWLSTISEVRTDPLRAIWIRPVDYRDVTFNTPFDPYVQPTSRGYRRQADREEFIGKSIPRHTLFMASNATAENSFADVGENCTDVPEKRS